MCATHIKRFDKFPIVLHDEFHVILHNFLEHTDISSPTAGEIQGRDHLSPGIRSPHSPLLILPKLSRTIIYWKGPNFAFLNI